MCYNASQRKVERQEILDEFGMSKMDVEYVPMYYHVNGFERPKMMIITEQEPETIQLATWSIAPPNSNDIPGYWKKTGGGCINTRVEALFEDRTPIWKREAMLERKCVFLIDGMYKVYTASNGRKIPMYVKRPNDALFGVLGYYTAQEDTLTASMLTTDSDTFFKAFHKRMTFTFDPEYIDSYLDINSENDYKTLIEHQSTNFMEYYPVNHDVINSYKQSNRPDITNKVTYDELNTLF